jgi:hypothetical protein
MQADLLGIGTVRVARHAEGCRHSAHVGGRVLPKTRAQRVKESVQGGALVAPSQMSAVAAQSAFTAHEVPSARQWAPNADGSPLSVTRDPKQDRGAVTQVPA